MEYIMPRYLFNPATNYGSIGGGGVVPVLLGGTGATSTDGAATNLGFVKTSSVGVANGVASLDGSGKLVAQLDWSKVASGKPTSLSGYGITDGVALVVVGANSGVASLDGSGKVPLAQIPSGLGASITGPTSVYVGQVVNYTINSFSTFASYTITTIGGTFTRTDATITFTTTASAGGAASITINGAVHTLTVLASSVVAPSITSPANNATGVSLVPTFTSSAFAYLGLSQTQDSVRWEISSSSGFGTTVQTYEGASNFTSWTPTSLSVNTTYYIRVKHHSSLGGWSAWSAVVSFATIAGYGWAVKLNTTFTGSFNKAAIDSSGNIYVISTDYSGITKFDNQGNVIWFKTLYTSGSYINYFFDIVIDTNDNIYVVGTGYIYGVNNQDALLVKFNTSGSVLWQRKIGSTKYECFYAVTVDSSGNVYAVGLNDEEYNSGLGITTNIAYITKWDATGTLTWQRSTGVIGSSEIRTYNGIALDSSGNIYAVGTSTSYGIGTAIITKFSSTGSLVWEKAYGSGYNGFINRIKIDSSDNIFIKGNVSGELVLIKLNTSGTIVWQKKFYKSDMSVLDSSNLIFDSNSNLYVSGYISNQSYDAFVAKLTSTGSLVWFKAIGGWNQPDQYIGITLDTGVNIYAVGTEATTNSGTVNSFITKWPSDSTVVPNTNLAGTGMTNLAIYAPAFTVQDASYSVSNLSLPTLNTPTFSSYDSGIPISNVSYTRYYSNI